MPKLTKEETLQLARLVVRSLNKVKGDALDHGRLALTNDRQFEQMTKLLKNHEQGIRSILFQSLEELGITAPLEPEELSRLK